MSIKCGRYDAEECQNQSCNYCEGFSDAIFKVQDYLRSEILRRAETPCMAQVSLWYSLLIKSLNTFEP